VGWWFEPTTFSQEAPADVKTEIPLATMTYVLRQRHSECPHFLFPFSFSFLSGSEAHFLFTAAFPFSGRVDPSAAFRRRCRVRDYQSLYASLPLRVASFTRFAPMP
jgi:hypothetical protein